MYNPDQSVYENILTYADELEKLYVIDNSEKYNEGLITQIKSKKNCCYISLHGNQGIARALNKAAGLAFREGYDWLLTMDQDSCFETEQLIKLKEFVEHRSEQNMKQIGALYADAKRYEHVSAKEIQILIKPITSGSFIELKAWKEVKGFDDKMFIDGVDHEYCARLRQKGYQAVRVNTITFNHRIGEQKKKSSSVSYNYPPIRYYYIIRNKLYLYDKYKADKKYIKELGSLKEAISHWVSSVRDEKRKGKKYVAMILGVLDYKMHRMGKCRWIKWLS